MFGLFNKNKNRIDDEMNALTQMEKDFYRNDDFSYENNAYSSFGGLTFSVEDVFTIMGRGIVVAGVVEGYVSVGDIVQILKNL